MNDEIENKILDPKSNPLLIGHGQAWDKLISSYNTDKFHHAWLITGSKGVGKETLIYRFIRYVMADFDDDVLENVHHPIFRQISHGNNFNILHIKAREEMASGQILMDDIKGNKQKNIAGVIPFLKTKVENGAWRFVIIDEAWRMNTSAQNALLKNLEEPPAKTVFFLLSENPKQLLSTISSRCQLLNTYPNENDKVKEYIKGLYPDLSDEDLQIVIHFSCGNIGKAVNFLENNGLAIWLLLRNLIEKLPELNHDEIIKNLPLFKPPKKDEPKELSKIRITIFMELIQWIVLLAIKYNIGENQAISDVDKSLSLLYDKLLSLHTPKSWLELNNNITENIYKLRGGFATPLHVYYTVIAKLFT